MFSDTDAAAALQGKDVWAAVGPCDSAATLAARSSKLEMVVPASGTFLFADMWAQPKRDGGVAPTLAVYIPQTPCFFIGHEATP